MTTTFWSPSLPTTRVVTRANLFKGGRRLVVQVLAPSLDPHCPDWDRPSAWAQALRDVKVVAGPPVPTFAVMVLEPSHKHLDGSPVIVRRCGHEHRSVPAAQRCCESLTRPYPDGARPAKWWGAAVRRTDGSPLTEAESDALYEAAR